MDVVFVSLAQLGIAARDSTSNAVERSRSVCFPGIIRAHQVGALETFLSAHFQDDASVVDRLRPTGRTVPTSCRERRVTRIDSQKTQKSKQCTVAEQIGNPAVPLELCASKVESCAFAEADMYKVHVLAVQVLCRVCRIPLARETF